MHHYASDPVEEMLAKDAAADHAKAAQRGERCLMVANSIISELHANGLAALDPDTLRPILFHQIATAFFGNVSVDIPPLRGAA
jgi:hypothetical protein